jgi:hypothetical protein
MTNKLSPEKIALLSDDKWLKHEYYDALKIAVEISIESNISYSYINRWYWFNKYIYYWLEPYIEDGIKFYDI